MRGTSLLSPTVIWSLMLWRKDERWEGSVPRERDSMLESDSSGDVNRYDLRVLWSAESNV